MQRARWLPQFLLAATLAIPTMSVAQIPSIKKPKAPALPTVAIPATTTAPAAQEAAPASAPADTGATSADQPGTGVWVNYDFQPGEIPLYVDDFSKDRVGNFPKRLEFVQGNMEVAEWSGARYLRATTRNSRFVVVLPDVLPERFTIEFDATGSISNINATIKFAPAAPSYVVYRYFNTKMQGGIEGSGPNAAGSQLHDAALGTLFRLRVMVDGKYVKVYIDDTRVANVPNADLGRSDRITFELSGIETQPAFIGNFSIMAGGRELYDALVESGRVATQGIYFASGSDEIRPESTPTLIEIAEMLKDHEDLILLIEGHTDDVGTAESNQALSQRRAAAVRQYLIDNDGIDGTRLTAIGFGEANPAAPNTTPEGRQQNRRVELVKK